MQEIVEEVMQRLALQTFLGALFLMHNTGAYLSRAFELSRIFQHILSVNLKFLPEPLFLSRGIASALLAARPPGAAAAAVCPLQARYSAVQDAPSQRNFAMF